MKRSREEGEMAAVNVPECLMLLSKVGESDQSKRVFVCKTCNREFSSFQALGGHRASHKKLKLISGYFCDRPVSQQKPKTQHECSVCGLEFAVGQALGGHMRKHRPAVGGSEGLMTRSLLPVQVLKKCNSKRVLCLDLNLMPSGDDLKLWVA